MKLTKKQSRDNSATEAVYDYYIAIDWSIDTAAIARMRPNSNEPKKEIIAPNIRVIKEYLKQLHGRKILTIEESTGSHWLYVELKSCVDKILICDPYRNSLLSEGPKTDKIDSGKLCKLLRAGLLREVYHSLDEDYKIRVLASSYEDIVKAGVRVLNQKSALYRAWGMRVKNGKLPNNKIFKFIEDNQNKSIELYGEQKENYALEFLELSKKKTVIKKLCSIPGIAEINAVKIYSRVIDPERFQSKYKYWSYCGLVKHQKESGARNYGQKQTRCCRALKNVYKSAALAATGGKNDLREYYEYLIREKSLSEVDAKNQIARYIAKVSLVILRTKQTYKSYQWRKE